MKRPYLMKGLNLMQPKSVKTAVFGRKTADLRRKAADFGLKVVKLRNSFHSRVRTQGENINFFLKICGF